MYLFHIVWIVICLIIVLCIYYARVRQAQRMTDKPVVETTVVYVPGTGQVEHTYEQQQQQQQQHYYPPGPMSPPIQPAQAYQYQQPQQQFPAQTPYPQYQYPPQQQYPMMPVHAASGGQPSYPTMASASHLAPGNNLSSSSSTTTAAVASPYMPISSSAHANKPMVNTTTTATTVPQTGVSSHPPSPSKQPQPFDYSVPPPSYSLAPPTPAGGSSMFISPSISPAPPAPVPVQVTGSDHTPVVYQPPPPVMTAVVDPVRNEQTLPAAAALGPARAPQQRTL